jgi:hypothetical protein
MLKNRIVKLLYQDLMYELPRTSSNMVQVCALQSEHTRSLVCGLGVTEAIPVNLNMMAARDFV